MKRICILVGFCIILLLQNCAQPTRTVQPALGAWTVGPQFEGVSRSGAISFTIKNIAYVGTGRDALNRALHDVWRYDPTQRAWTQVPDFPGKDRSLAVAFTIGDKGYVGTGYDANGDYLRDFYEYDPVSNSWKRIADFGGSARYSALAFSIGQTGFVGTGYDGQQLRDLWAYDPATNRWLRKADFGGSARVGASSFVINNLAYIGRGSTQAIQTTNPPDFWMYDPAQDSWLQRRNFPDARLLGENGLSFVINNVGYLLIGSSSPSVWAYNAVIDSWTQRSAFEGRARSFGTGFSLNSKGFVVTGQLGSTRLDDVWEFDPNL